MNASEMYIIIIIIIIIITGIIDIHIGMNE